MFNETCENFKSFIIAFCHNFESKLHWYNPEQNKIMIASLHLSGAALHWWEAQTNELTGAHSYTAFTDWCTVLKAASDDPDARQTADNKLCNLRQDNRDVSVHYL